MLICYLRNSYIAKKIATNLWPHKVVILNIVVGLNEYLLSTDAHCVGCDSFRDNEAEFWSGFSWPYYVVI